jgi:hypothetical protein
MYVATWFSFKASMGCFWQEKRGVGFITSCFFILKVEINLE